jgi:hypothetical protein
MTDVNGVNEMTEVQVERLVELFGYDSDTEELADEVRRRRLVDLFGYDSDTEEMADEEQQGKVDFNNQRLVNENNAGREIVDSAHLLSSCVEIDATRRPPDFDSWKLIRIDRSDPSVLIGKSYSDYFIVSDYQKEDFELAWQAFLGRKLGVKSGISRYCPKHS